MDSEAPLFVQLQEGLHKLTRNQRVLAKYVLSNYQSVAFANVKELARLSGVSEATIVRFARSLRFSGYPSFQKEIRRLVRADLKGTERFQLAEPASKESRGAEKGRAARSARAAKATDTALSAVIRKELENISQLNELHDPKAFAAALEAVRDAPEVVTVGSRSAACIAHHLWFGLSKLGVRATRVMSITSETYDFVNTLDAKACVFLVSFPRHLKETLNLLAFLKNRGVRTVCITDSPFSPARGDVSLYAPAESASFVGFHSAPLILVNALLHEFSLIDKNRTLGVLGRFEALADAQSYFSKD